jgi:hypothetical protein
VAKKKTTARRAKDFFTDVPFLETFRFWAEKRLT